MATASTSTSKSASTAKSATKSAASATKSAASATKAAAKKVSASKKAPPTKKASASSRPRPATKSSGTSDPSALRVLRDDHRTVEALFARFEQLGPRAHRAQEEVVRRVIAELSAHADIEETVFYPAVREALQENDLVLEALEEHHLVKVTLAELDGMAPTAERYVAKMTVLMEMVRHHVEEEEDELFPKVRDAMTRTQLDDLGAMLLNAKESAARKPHPHAPDTPPGNILVSAVTNPIDAARSVGEAAIRKVRKSVGA